MKNLLIGLFLTPLLAVGAEETPDLLIPGGAWWRAKSKAVISESIQMTGPAQLEADEITIEAPIVTNGHRLDHHARKLIFKPGGKILSFDKPAAEGLAGPGFRGPAASRAGRAWSEHAPQHGQPGTR